jgi:Zn-dependent peptidase ImmA (M78 family)
MKTSPRLPDPTVVAEKLLAKAGIKAPPVDLSQVTSTWSNLFVVEEELDGSGYLLPIGELGAEILINKGDHEERKRFTIAHELGHWVLGLSLKKKIGHFAQPKETIHAETERWCDTFATNILMPEFMIQASVPHADPVVAINFISEAASRFKVSEEAFYIRLWEALRLQVAFLTLKHHGGERGYAIQRSFADKREGLALERLLNQRGVTEQLDASAFPIFSLISDEGKIRCAARKVSNERFILILKWPDVKEP